MFHHLKPKILERVNLCLVQKTLLCPVSHSLFLPSPPGCYGNLDNITPNTMGCVCVSTPSGGPESGCAFSPSGEVSFHKGFPSVVLMLFLKSITWFRSGFILLKMGFKSFDNTMSQCNRKCSFPSDQHWPVPDEKGKRCRWL